MIEFGFFEHNSIRYSEIETMCDVPIELFIFLEEFDNSSLPNFILLFQLF